MRARWGTLVRCAPALAAALAGCGTSGRVTMAVHASSNLMDAPVRVDVRGLKPHERATLEARWTAFGGAAWTSSTPLRADAEGTATLRGVDGMRFLWDMQPARAPRGSRSFVVDLRGRNQVPLSVVAGGKTVARASIIRRAVDPSVEVRTLTVRREGVHGVLFLPRGPGSRRPGVLVLGGSEGGVGGAAEASMLASHGYPALALAYFRAPGLPPRAERIPLEYFARALRILGAQPGVDPARLVTMGISLGGEASLLVASKFPRLVHGAIGLVPNSSVPATIAGRYVPWTYRGRAVPSGPIAVERIRGPVLTAGAGQDWIWYSGEYVRAIEHRLAAHAFPFAHRGLVYASAGHLAGSPIPYWPRPTDQQQFGGSAAADAAARADLWPRILHYLARL